MMPDWKVYHCPVTKRFLDPFELYRLLGFYSRGQWNRLVDSGNTDALITVGRLALRMPKPNEKTGLGGWLEPDVEKALEAFGAYVEGKEPTDDVSRASSPSQESRPAFPIQNPCLDCP